MRRNLNTNGEDIEPTVLPNRSSERPMIMLLALLACVFQAAVILILYEILSTVVRDRLSQRLFRKQCPNIPIAPNVNIFGGHIKQIIWSKQSWKKLDELHKEYGQTVCMFYGGQPYVSTVDLNFIKAIVIDSPNDHLSRFKFRTALDELEFDSILSCEGEQWRKIRTVMAPAFTKTKILMPNVQSEIKSVIQKLVDSFESRLDRAKSERSESFIELDVDEMFLRYANALVFSCFYKQTDEIDFEAKVDPFSNVIDSCIRASIDPVATFGCIFPKFLPIIRLLLLRFHPLGTVHYKINSFIKRQTVLNLKAKQQVDEHRYDHSFDADNIVLADGSKFKRNLIDYIIDQFHEGKLTESEYFNSTGFLFLAASKSSADAISKLIYNLAAEQDEQIKLRESIRAEGVDSEYLHWSINESMRLFPPAPGGCSRTLSHEMKTSDGSVIPAGTLIHTPVHLISRLSEYWGSNPNKYRPERWRHSSSFHPVQYLAFGAGKRRCFGGEFALREIKMLMSELLTRYKFQLASNTNPETILQFDAYMFFTLSEFPINIIISRL